MANIQAEVEKIKKQIKERSAPKPKGLPSGDRGQRFAVMARLNGGEPICLGWSESASGGVLGNAAMIHPEWSDLRIVDRDPQGKRPRVLRITCRKCAEQFQAGHDRCSYCNGSFTQAFIAETNSDGTADQVVRCGHCGAVVADLQAEHECEPKLQSEALKVETVEAVGDERRANERFVARQDKLSKLDAKVKDGGISEKAGA